MKSLLLVAMFLSSQMVFAGTYRCVKKVDENRTEGTMVQTWPQIQVDNDYWECFGDEGMKTCKGGGENIASNYNVCYQRYDVPTQCVVTEDPAKLNVEINCNNGASVLAFETDSERKGTIKCLENGILRKQWDLGACRVE